MSASAELRTTRAALVRCVKTLRAVLDLRIGHDEGCHPSEGRHTPLCRRRKKVLTEARAILEGGLYEIEVRR